MKSKNQLLQELDSFGSFAKSLTDLSEEFLNTPLYEDISIKRMISNIYLQDKTYLEYYFPLMIKDAEIKEYDKNDFNNEVEILINEKKAKDIIETLVLNRKSIVSFLNRLAQEQLHTFFEIDGVKFTMYDHIEHIIWNDQIQKDEILKYII